MDRNLVCNQSEDWKDLPGDLLRNIADNLNTYTNYTRFRAVCASWRSTLPEFPKHSYHQVPWVLLPSYPFDENVQSFYNPLNEQVCIMELPPLRDRFCCGSSDGWLVTFEKSSSRLELFNPLTKSQLQLPPASSFPHLKRDHVDIWLKNGTGLELFNPITNSQLQLLSTSSSPPLKRDHVDLGRCKCSSISKIVLSSSSSSSSNDFTAVAIHGESSKLAFSKVGNDKWMPILTFLEHFQDCIFFKEKIYAVTSNGDLVIAPINNPMKAVNLFQVKPPKFTPTFKTKLYLVSFGDELVMVAKTRYARIKFNLFKLEETEKGARWLKINNLDGYTIFLGLNTSMCISSKYCPKLNGNQIYYTADKFQLTRGAFCGCNFDVYDIANDNCLDFNFLYPTSSHLKCNFMSPPIWVVLDLY